jgi:hypothetical protein
VDWVVLEPPVLEPPVLAQQAQLVLACSVWGCQQLLA